MTAGPGRRAFPICVGIMVFGLLLFRSILGPNEMDVLPHAKQFYDPEWLPGDWFLNREIAYRRGALVTRTEIYDHIYDETDPTFSNVLDVYVANLRRKLGRQVIVTRRGQGYMIP